MPPDQQGHRKALVEPTIEFSDTDVVFVMAGPVKADDIQIEEEN